jgi:hypothetical protein
MDGGKGSDTMHAGWGFGATTSMTGGEGKDHFQFNMMGRNANTPVDKMIITDFIAGYDKIDIVSRDNTLNFAKWDRNGDGKLGETDFGVSTMQSSDGKKTLWLAMDQSSVIEVHNYVELSSNDFTFTVL